MPISGPLRSFFDSLTSEDSLTHLVATKRREDLHLEFKTKKDSRTPEVDKDSDSWQFSRALSGFANSDGGILIWGIKTDDKSQACSLKPVQDPETFRERLQKSLLNAVIPMVDGIEFRVIPSLTEPSVGYVACLIPASETLPHRAMLADREYYKRTAEGFYRLEHFDLADLFGRRPNPRLDLFTAFLDGGSTHGLSGTTFRKRAILAIRNLGRGVARSPFLAFETNPAMPLTLGIDGNGRVGLPQIPVSDPAIRRYGGSTSIVIVPGTSLEVCGLEVQGTFGTKSIVAHPQGFVLTYRIGCEDSPLVEGNMTFTDDFLRGVVFPEGLLS